MSSLGQNIRKLDQAEAGRILSPVVIGAQFLVQSTLEGTDPNNLLKKVELDNVELRSRK